MSLRLVICQDWEESERGWGVRPDGWTMHLTRSDRDAYVREYNQTFHVAASVPAEYTRISGEPRTVEVDEETYRSLMVHTQLPDASDRLRHPFQKLGMWGEGRFGPKRYEP